AAYPGWRGSFAPSDVCPAYVFDRDHDGSDVLGKKSIRRHVSGMHKAGVVDVRHLTRAADVHEELDDFFQQHVDRRAVTDVPSAFLESQARTFYGLLADRLAADGRLLFTVV